MASRQLYVMKDCFLNGMSDKMEYRRTTGKTFSFAWGQRKLLLGKIMALVEYWDPVRTPNIVVVYAGAAPFSYANILDELFCKLPGHSVTFLLYDPRPIKLPEGLANFEFFQEYFTDEIAVQLKEKYAGTPIFFFSDIRTVDSIRITREIYAKHGVKLDSRNDPIPGQDPARIAEAKTEKNLFIEEGIFGDMEMQQRWVEIMDPEHAFLKMRLPYMYDTSPESHKKLQYLAGEVILQPWTKMKSTETRLHPIKIEDESGVLRYQRKNWDSKEYESYLAYHNVIVRAQRRYYNPLTDDPGDANIDEPELLADWDSTTEAKILQRYVEKMGVSADKTTETVLALSRTITAMLDPTGKKTLSSIRETVDTLNDPFRKRHN